MTLPHLGTEAAWTPATYKHAAVSCSPADLPLINTLQPAVSALESFIFSSGSRNTPHISGEGITLHVLITAFVCKKSRKCSLQWVQSEEFSGYCPPFSCKTSGSYLSILKTAIECCLFIHIIMCTFVRISVF